MFTKFGSDQLNSDEDRRGSLCGVGVRDGDIIARHISVTVQDSPNIAANDY